MPEPRRVRRRRSASAPPAPPPPIGLPDRRGRGGRAAPGPRSPPCPQLQHPLRGLCTNCATTISLWTLLPLTDMGDMGDPPKSKRLFYLVGLGVLVCAGVSLARVPRARRSWSDCLERRTETVALAPGRHACMLCCGF